MSENLAKMAHDFFCDYRQTRDFVLRNDAVQASKDMDSIVAALKRPTDDRVQKLVEDVAEYLHWREVNPHIKGGENYLKRFKQALEAL